MTHVARFRHADPKRVRPFGVDLANAINLGDLVYQAVDDIRAAGGFTYVTGSLSRTQANFRKDFMGVALTSHVANDAAVTQVMVAQAGTFEFDCAAATFELGDRVGPDDNAGGTALIPNQVIAIGGNGHGEIGKVAKRYSANTTSLLVELTPIATLRPNGVLFLPVFNGSTTTAADILTAFPVEFPFKLVRTHAIVGVAYTGTDVLTVKKGAVSLTETLSVTGAVGAPVSAAVTTAGEGYFLAGDTLSIATDGGSTSGTALVMLEIIPFLHES